MGFGGRTTFGNKWLHHHAKRRLVSASISEFLMQLFELPILPLCVILSSLVFGFLPPTDSLELNSNQIHSKLGVLYSTFDLNHTHHTSPLGYSCRPKLRRKICHL